MKAIELQKIVKHLIDTYGEVDIYPFDTDFAIDIEGLPEMETFFVDKDYVDTYEKFLAFEQEEIKPVLQEEIAKLTKQQEKLKEKIERLG